MLYRVRASGAVLTQGEVRGLYPNTSFPAVWNADVCDAIGVDPILPSPQPTTSQFQSAAKDGVEQDANGNWVEKWTVTDWDASEIAAATEKQWEIIRTERNKLLAESDWTQLQDAPVDDRPWATYRQALRDITAQPDPFNITWPTSP